MLLGEGILKLGLGGRKIGRNRVRRSAGQHNKGGGERRISTMKGSAGAGSFFIVCCKARPSAAVILLPSISDGPPKKKYGRAQVGDGGAFRIGVRVRSFSSSYRRLASPRGVSLQSCGGCL